MMKLKQQEQPKAPSTPRKKTASRDLPENLYVYNGYYKYRNPQTGKTKGFGTDMQYAIKAATLSNFRLYTEDQGIELVERAVVSEIHDDKSITVSALIERYKNESEKFAQLKASTHKEEMYRLNRLQNHHLHCLPNINKL